MNIFEFDVTTLKLFHRLALLAPDINIWFMFQKAGDVDRCRRRFSDIGSEGKQLAGSLSTEYNRHHADEELDDGVFSRAKKGTSIPK